MKLAYNEFLEGERPFFSEAYGKSKTTNAFWGRAKASG
jgi:hypothetical protein